MGTKLIEAWKTNKIKKEWKIAFIATFVIGLLVHLYKFSNNLMNNDSLIYDYSSQTEMIVNGRWFLVVPTMLSSYFNLPWINGIFSLIFISLTMVLIVEIFKMENPVLIVIGGGILVSFPAITETFVYEFVADGYTMAMLFAAIAVYITRMETPGVWRTVIAAILICLACGIYQSYVSFALVLAICYFIFSVLKEKLETKNLFKWIGRQAIIYVAGLVLFYIIWQILLKVENIDAADYMGISSMGLSLSNIVSVLPNFVRDIGFFFLGSVVYETGWTVHATISVIFLASFAVAYIAVIIKQKMLKRKLQLLLILVATVAIPFAACMWYFASSSITTYRSLMLTSLSILYIFLGVIVEEFLNIKWKNVVMVLLSVIIVEQSVLANITYYYMNKVYEATYSEATEMLSRIHLLDTDVTKIAVVSQNISKSLEDTDEIAARYYFLIRALDDTLLINSQHTVLFMNEYLNQDYEYATDEEIEALCELEEVQEMGTWPSSDSVEVVDDYIVIKMTEIETDAE